MDLSRVGEIFFRPFGAWILGNLSNRSLRCGQAGHGHSSAASRLDSGGRRFSHGDAYMETQKNPASRKGRQIWDPDSLQRFDRIYFRRALRGQVAGKQCNTEKPQWCENKGRQIMRADSVEHARHEPGQQ
jgi:hypothetical protein